MTTRRISSAEDVASLDFAKGSGLVTVIAQHAHTREVLMVAHADRDALEATLRTGEMHYRSRTRGAWHKGATSGNVQRVVVLYADCDADAVLALVTPAGNACHTGERSCFGETESPFTLATLDAVIAARASAGDAASYTRKLLSDRNLRLKKLGEEVAELVTACADEDRERAANEAADVMYHTLVALRAVGVDLAQVEGILRARHTRPAVTP